MCNYIQKFVYDAFLLFAIQKRDRVEEDHMEEFLHVQHESPFKPFLIILIKTKFI